MSFHTFLSSEPKLVSDEKMEMLIEETFDWMRRLLLQDDYLLSKERRFVQFTWKFFKRLGYLFDKEKYDAMPESVLDGRGLERENFPKYRTELSWEVFKEISEYYNIKWKRKNKRLNRNQNSQSGRQNILADAFLNTGNGMDGNKIYTQIIENKEFEHYLVEDEVVTESWCDIMLYDANKNSKSVIL